jgi:hypothetical protein
MTHSINLVIKLFGTNLTLHLLGKKMIYCGFDTDEVYDIETHIIYWVQWFKKL